MNTEPILTETEPTGSGYLKNVRGPSRAFLLLLAAAAVSVFLLITLGGVVRVTDSGLGCPDWPLCHGRLLPPLEFHTIIEYSHRLAASFTSTLVTVAAAIAWWRYRRVRHIVLPLTFALALIGVAAGLGGITVLLELPPTIVTLHLATAELIFALLLATLVWAWRSRRPQRSAADPRVRHGAAAAALTTLVVIISGSYVVGSGAGTACPQWPLCGSGALPSYSAGWLHMVHRLIAAIGALLTVWAALMAWRRRGDSASIGWASALAGGVAIAQVLVGAANPWTGFSAVARAAHLSLATAMWGSFVVLGALSWQPSPDAKVEGRSAIWAVLADYIALTKPRIILLLLVTSLGGMFLAAKGVPPLSTAILVLVGGSLAAGGANALNHYFDQDIDQRMRRTQQRPLPAGRIPPGRALWFGVALNVIAFIMLALGVNLLSALLTLGATVFYVVVYTRWLKRTTTQNIVIGGAAGAVPPLVGWAAITGGLDLPALYLFAIVFFWTPPHFWALALLLRNDYERAHVPMLPVVMGIPETVKSILLHSLILVSITILFFTVQAVGWLYLSGAVLLGAYFLFLSWRLFRTQAISAARHLYLYSLLYLALLFALIIVDSVVAPWPR
ncbi:MAG: protoheme IX farnesyltransferase [Dehalococcoidia bacterium]|nr:protoheme IX farnesyltransferase [Dehalococcoidia bacterium]